MADNIEEENLDDSTNTQSENPTDDITPTTDTETIATNQEIENMEVHHHAHDPAAPHPKKNWKSYFWEFLMLFLAVFCGFLAEYQLEHKIEKERAVKYMHDMVENIKYDTIRYNRNLENNVLLGKQLDSLRAEISEAIKGNMHSNRLYNLWLKSRNFSSASFNRSAITQLKNSGNLRLVKNDSLVTLMIDYYDRKIFACEQAEENMQKLSASLNASCLQFFSYEPFDDMIKTESNFGKSLPDSVIEKNKRPLYSNPPLILLNTNSKALMLLYNDVASKEIAIKNYNSFLRWAKETAEILMIQIENEYHFKN